jgi:hypothetical protein
MTAQAYTTRMPAGFVGLISRDIQAQVVESELLDSTNTPAAYGVPVKTTSGKLRGFVSGDTASVISGFLVRGYPRAGSMTSPVYAYGSQTPVAGELAARMRRGYLMVTCAYGTPTVDGTVYVRVTASGGVRTGGAVGDLEATADSTYNAAVTGARWTGSLSSDGTTAEIAYNM